MYHKNRSLLIILMLAISLAGCGTKIPDVGIPPENINRDLLIRADRRVNDFTTLWPIALTISLKTDIEVKTNTVFNARMFIFNEDLQDWREVKERTSSLLFGEEPPPSDLLLCRKCKYRDTTIFLSPDLPLNPSGPVDIVIFVSGSIYEDGMPTGEITGAYIILNLKPWKP